MIQMKLLFTKPSNYGFIWILRYYNGKIDPIAKRGSMLYNMIADKDKKKKWHLTVMANTVPKGTPIFDRVHKPSKRQQVLNSLFIKNITDVFSTGDIAPDILNFGIEITGVKVSQDYQLVNVFWQAPPSFSHAEEEISSLLNTNASKIRSELISRNVLGRVPRIYFLRDTTNAKVAAFEEALKQVEDELSQDKTTIPDDSFIKNIYSFKEQRVTVQNSVKKKISKSEDTSQNLPQRPPDMKSNVFGLDRDILMNKIIAKKHKLKSPVYESAVISSDSLPAEDLFSRIPGTTIGVTHGREELLKKFCTERKIMRTRKTQSKEDCYDIACDYELTEEDAEEYNSEQDYIVEETRDKT